MGVVMAHGEGGKIATKSASSIHQTIHQSYAARSSFARRSLDTPWRLKVEHFGGLNRTEERFKDLTKSNIPNPSPASYRIMRFGDKINTQIPTASFNSTTTLQEKRKRLSDGRVVLSPVTRIKTMKIQIKKNCQ